MHEHIVLLPYVSLLVRPNMTLIQNALFDAVLSSELPMQSNGAPEENGDVYDISGNDKGYIRLPLTFLKRPNCNPSIGWWTCKEK